jgi:thiamine pyrophosphate-dependent acetolactate synthase large subunit-like protein
MTLTHLLVGIVAEALLDWKVDAIFGLPGDGINGFIEEIEIIIQHPKKDRHHF